MTKEIAPPITQYRVIFFLFAAVALVLIVAYLVLFRGGYVSLEGPSHGSEAAAVVTELNRLGVPYRLEGTDILVPRDKLQSARKALAAAEIPEMGVEGFELFNESQMGLTDFAQKIKYQRALQGELARTIMMMDGIREARVHLALAERSLFRSEEGRAKAAVTLVLNGEGARTLDKVHSIQRVVAAAVPSLQIEDVVVVDADGAILSPPVLPVADAQILSEVQAAIAQLGPGFAVEWGGISERGRALYVVRTREPLDVKQQSEARAVIEAVTQTPTDLVFEVGPPLQGNPSSGSPAASTAALTPREIAKDVGARPLPAAVGSVAFWRFEPMPVGLLAGAVLLASCVVGGLLWRGARPHRPSEAVAQLVPHLQKELEEVLAGRGPFDAIFLDEIAGLTPRQLRELRGYLAARTRITLDELLRRRRHAFTKRGQEPGFSSQLAQRVGMIKSGRNVGVATDATRSALRDIEASWERSP